MIGPNHLTHQDRNGQVGELLPGINDNYLGGAPALGAHELGAPLQRYGPRNAATCGDNRVEGEGICPTACSNGDSCTIDILSGDA